MKTFRTLVIAATLLTSLTSTFAYAQIAQRGISVVLLLGETQPPAVQELPRARHAMAAGRSDEDERSRRSGV